MAVEREEAPQGLEEKLAVGRSTGGRARCNWRHLERYLGGVKVVERDAAGPLVVEVRPMDVTHRWRRVSKDTFELETSNP